MKFQALTLVAAMILVAGCSSSPKTTATSNNAAVAKPAAPAATSSSTATTTKPAAAAKTDNKASGDAMKVTCKGGGEERVLESEAVNPKGCKLWYTKGGKRTDVASSSNGTQHCKDVFERIQKKLEGSGYACN